MLPILAVLLIAANAPKDDATKKEVAKLLGTWRVQSAQREGQPLEGFKDGLTASTKDGKIAVKFPDGTEGGYGTYTLDLTLTPKGINYTLDYGPYKGKEVKGIYSTESDTLKICRSDPGKERPKEFTTKADSGRMLFTAKREKR